MRLKEYGHTWPPKVSSQNPEFANGLPKPELDDVVFKVQNRAPGELGIWLRSLHSATEYTTVLSLPAKFQQEFIFKILRKADTSLQEIGEFEIPTLAEESVLSDSVDSTIKQVPVENSRNWLDSTWSLFLTTTGRFSVSLRMMLETTR